jgi:peroxiredoxin (alkyl hydroperoxide reductase subunit C)
VVRTILYYPLELGRNIKEILSIVKSLQLIDRTGAVVPANWPRNETVKDGLLLLAPTSREEARLRLAQFKGCVSCLPSGRRPKRTLRRP